MESTFRKRMSWVHTWVGLVICALLFAIFWMGTLAVFDREIDRWMMPMTRLQRPTHRRCRWTRPRCPCCGSWRPDRRNGP